MSDITVSPQRFRSRDEGEAVQWTVCPNHQSATCLAPFILKWVSDMGGRADWLPLGEPGGVGPAIALYGYGEFHIVAPGDYVMRGGGLGLGPTEFASCSETAFNEQYVLESAPLVYTAGETADE